MNKFIEKSYFSFLKLDKSGNAAVEFALLLPLMLTILFGTIEVTNMLMSDRKVVNATQAAADLIAQSKSLTAADIDDVYAATRLILAPFDASTLRLGVAHIRYNASNAPYSVWTDSRNGGTVSDALVISAGLGKSQESVVVVQVEYTYNPILGNLFFSPSTYTKKSVSRPRRVLWIPKT